jgi:HAD superfamily hydrolase (TIGR01509 family)
LSRKPPAAVLFDCDGVLADTEAMHNRIMAEEISALGWEMDAATCERLFIGLSWEGILPKLHDRLGPDAVPPTFLEDLVRRVMHALNEEVVPIPGVLGALEAILAAGIPVAVASNSSRPELATKLRQMGLVETFRGRAFSRDDVDRPKPAPDMFRAAAEACGVSAHGCVVVEDSVTGARAGIAAGCRVLGYGHGAHQAALAAVGAEPFDDMRDLPALLGITEPVAR